jgi:hypothetical protein
LAQPHTGRALSLRLSVTANFNASAALFSTLATTPAPTRAGDHRSRDQRMEEQMKIHSVVGGGGVKLHVREWGKVGAPPVLFIHGWS